MRDGAYSHFCFVDQFTWPKALEIYAHSDPEHFSPILKLKISRQNFETLLNHRQVEIFRLPYESCDVKVQVLSAFCSALLDSEIIRDFLAKPKREHTDEETCRSCQAKGELVLCASCPAGYHHACAKLDIDAEAVKADSFIFECPVCIQNKIQLVTDCVASFEKDPMRYVRHKTLGHDRHGRRYWFLVRRIWVEDSNKNCWYYSTPQQLESLLELLDQGYYSNLF